MATKAPGTACFLRASVEHNFPDSAVRAALRLRLRKGHRQLPSNIRCPGCAAVLTADSYAAHTNSCVRVKGFNASARHAYQKTALQTVFKQCGVPFDGHEPREHESLICKGCNTKLLPGEVDSHVASCRSLTAMHRASTEPKVRRTGPDIRCYLGGVSTVIDVTITSPTAPSFINKGVKAAINARIAEKTRLYSSAVEAAGEEFVIAGFSSFGEIYAGTASLVSRAVASGDPASVNKHELNAMLSTVAALTTGLVIATAERRSGVIATEACQTAQYSSGRLASSSTARVSAQ